ncbi:hypothetical protein O6H91_20G072100 [Diphasiastrum complanatum]|uniref:Uncharacterized protein n=2 Tax=Diphasiastrum complanatum TaxID=34168 RepID=A0ACC2ARW5_DIPCM|nr:hypothetical protein O6H91_20G072100 [Diphasiastrum complanatum]KAJ7520205.1 hypothetical protein O6H91_20G072100 [Diphasiastrum complanatum]
MWRVSRLAVSRASAELRREHKDYLENLVGLRLCGCNRRSSTAAAAVVSASGEHSPELGRLIEARVLSKNLSAFSAKPSVVLPASSPTALEQSVSTLDTALLNAVHWPWLANQLFHLLPVDSSQNRIDAVKAGGQQALDNEWSYRSNGFSGATVPQNLDIDKELWEYVRIKKLDSSVISEASSHLQENSSHIQKRSLYARQRKIETEAWQLAAKEYKDLMVEMCRRKLAPNLPFAKSLLLGWFEPLRDAITAELRSIEAGEYREDRSVYGPYVKQLPADMLAVITMHRLMGLLMHDTDAGAVRLVYAALQIGDAVEQEAKIFRLFKKPGRKKKDKLEINVEDAAAKKKVQKKVKEMIKQQKHRRAKKLLNEADDSNSWGTVIHAKVGCRLIEIMLEAAFVQPPAGQSLDDTAELRPAFRHTMHTSTTKRGFGRRYGVIECDPLVKQEIDKSVRHMVIPYMPMLVPPRQWKGYSNGGHLYLRSYVMRTHGAKQQKEAVKKTSKKHLQYVYEALDTLGSTRWRINKVVLDAVETIWKDGGRLADLVDCDSVIVPAKPEIEDEEVIRSWRRLAAKAKRINSERHSQKCDTELKLNVSRKLRDEEGFYYPHNLDFRGRAYPMHPHLNHLGSDMCRGILEFAEGRPLGSTGLHWLKIHLANVFANGIDKLSFDGRIAFVDTQLDNILDSAERPLEGERWWLGAEDPFQCLAACIDLSNALRSGNVENYISHLPIHQDGSCNGLQHYAALGRDRVGAQSVNLISGEAPADVYSGIATRVRAIIEKEAVKDPSSSQSAASARLLLGQVDRKLVKQTVMTSVYGVTFIGARTQIMNRLKERSTITDDAELYRAACYAAKITLEALGQMFKEARCIMGWLGDCAKIIASEGEAVRWHTPLGLPVVQPYRKPGRIMVKTSLQVLALRKDDQQPVMVQRQRSAFPPNFVHSLDGSHMMMTAVACKNAGLTFAGVHDSFWTHAGNVEQMNRILREKFVELYNQPILEELLKSFEKRFPNLEFPPVPDRGDLDLNEVLKAPYFFN